MKDSKNMSPGGLLQAFSSVVKDILTNCGDIGMWICQSIGMLHFSHMDTFISTLILFGIKPSDHPFLFLSFIIIACSVYLKISLGGTLGKVKDNLLVIITHLSASNRSKLNVTLIKQMSPLTIQPAGKQVLIDSGFNALIKKDKNKERFFSIITAMKPKTKLEVENYAIYSFLNLMTNDGDMMNPVKVYLYEHPDIRDTFPTLAGVLVRDKYLEEHREISE